MADETTIELANGIEVVEGVSDRVVWLRSGESIYTLTQHELSMLADGNARVKQQ